MNIFKLTSLLSCIFIISIPSYPDAISTKTNATPSETPTKGYAVDRHNGAPTIFRDGKPFFAHLYFNQTWSPDESTGPHVQEMYKTGIHMHFISAALDWGDESPSGEVATQYGAIYPALDKRLRAILKMDPEAKFLLNVHTFVPFSWYETHPEEIPTNEDGTLIKTNLKRASNSFASKLWKEEVGKRIVALINHMKETEYYDAIIGFCLFVGWEGQWTWFSPDKQYYPSISHLAFIKLQTLRTDHSQAMTAFFRSRLKKKYGDDISLLQKTWEDKEITFETIKVPSEDIVDEVDFYLFKNPEKGRTKYVRDYFESFMAARTEAMNHFAKVIKDNTRENSKLAGSYFASILYPFVGGTHNVVRQMSGYEFLNSPYIDFFCTPGFHASQEMGGAAPSNFMIDSMHLHDKFVFYEHDQATHLARRDANSLVGTDGIYLSETGEHSAPKNLNETIAMLKRNFSYVICKGRLGIWWWDRGFRHENGNLWFGDPLIHDTFAKCSRIGKESLLYDCASTSEIAVIFSEESSLYLDAKPFDGLGRNLIIKQMKPLQTIGAPYDIYEICDLKNMPPYKLYIFWNTFYLSDEQRQLIVSNIKKNNSTVLWIYAPGFVADSGLSVEKVSKLTGIRMGMLQQANSVITQVTNADHQRMPLLRDCPSFRRRKQITPGLVG